MTKMFFIMITLPSNSNEVERLRVNIDRKLTFHWHIKKCVVKQVKNWVPYWDSLHTLIPIKEKKCTLPWSNYCPLVWMFFPRRWSNLINRVQERALCITYKDQLTDFKSILLNQNEITTHQRNLQVLLTEIYKIINHIVPPIMSSLFETRENTYNTKHFQVLSNESWRTVNHDLETSYIPYSTFYLGKCTARI